MFGANDFGQAVYGQGAAVAEDLHLKTLTASVEAIGSIEKKTIINRILTASVTAVGSIHKTFMRTLTATVTTTGTVATLIIKALNLIQASTKFLTPTRTTRNLTPERHTAPLSGLNRTTRRVK